jgi:monoamine oxidase
MRYLRFGIHSKPPLFRAPISRSNVIIPLDIDRKPQIEKLIFNGLPKITDSTKVVVVGAGISGICTAYELLRAGYDVTVLERTQRPGNSI